MEKYDIKHVLGKGKFGTIYLANIRKIKGFEGKTEIVAIKTELQSQEYRSIKHEVKMMNYLFRNKFKQLPMIYWYGNYQNLVCLVMTYYECSLEKFLQSQPIIEIKNSIMKQCICIFEHIHKYYVLHRDIKPQNFMIKDNNIFLIDFGLAIFYIDEDGEHKPNNHQETIIGTPKYISYYNHIGYTISRRDEMISLGYMYMSFFGILPWQNITIIIETTDKSMLDIYHPINIYRKKYKSLEYLFNNIIEPEYSQKTSLIIKNYMKYCYSLEYDEEPKYQVMQYLFN